MLKCLLTLTLDSENAWKEYSVMYVVFNFEPSILTLEIRKSVKLRSHDYTDAAFQRLMKWHLYKKKQKNKKNNILISNYPLHLL